MQARYDQRVPNPENFTPQRPIRVPDDAWNAYGAIVGERDRSADLKAYIEWRLAHPTAPLPPVPEEQVLDFLVRIRIDDDGRRVEITELPGVTGPLVDRLKTEIRQAIAGQVEPPQSGPKQALRTRKAAK